MGLAEELLATTSDVTTTHTHVGKDSNTHAVKDPDTHFVIDPDTREITNYSYNRHALMQYDHQSEIFTFELPRYVENHDMTLCNRVRVHFINTDEITGEHNSDVAEMDDLSVNSVDENTVVSTWCIRREATQLAGTLSFAVQYMCVDDDGAVTYEWHTDIYSGVEVKAGLNNGDASVVNYSNILEEWYQKLFEETSSADTYALVDEAQVGQAAVVEEVDENNVPTKWKAVDYPTDEHINGLINTALGVIENGSY